MDTSDQGFHSLTDIPGGRRAYIASLPSVDQSGEPLDFSADDYEQVRNATTGMAAAWDDYQRGAMAVAADPQFNQYLPGYRASKIAEANAVVAAESLETVLRGERRAELCEQEAAEIHSSLLVIDRIDPAVAAPLIASFQALPKEQRVAQLHDLSAMLADPKVSPAERQEAREYLAAVMSVNKHARLVPEATRSHVTEVMGRTKNSAKWAKARHLEIGAQTIREAAGRVRELIGNGASNDNGRRARFVRS